MVRCNNEDRTDFISEEDADIDAAEVDAAERELYLAEEDIDGRS